MVREKMQSNPPPPSIDHFDKVQMRDSSSLNSSYQLNNNNNISHTKSILDNFLNSINALGEDAQKIYDENLQELRKKPEDIVIEIAREEKIVEISDYAKRWSLIYTATELKDRASLPLLKNIVLTPIPPEKSKDPHSFSTVAEETILRTTAVDGVRSLAEQGDKEALKSLFEFVSIPSISIRRAAVQAILSTSKGKEVREKLKELLPNEQHFLLDLKPIDVRDVPQIKNPKQHLKASLKGSTDKPKQPKLQSNTSTRDTKKDRKSGPNLGRDE
ncbi:MAG TPA: HEAT repeat domain-containing protein [Nitrososphaeraceae archaeon]|nr:HEAT repeat domain-containing protein [Nitrososphaeraceae archaeon]